MLRSPVMLNTERRQPLEVIACLRQDVDYLHTHLAHVESYSIPLLELVRMPCASLARELGELIAKKSRPILVKDTPHGPARLSE
jgi:hypothetical protein